MALACAPPEDGRQASMQEFEKLGVFYLGKKRDLAANTTTDELVLYDSKHLTTHAVVVGMTGSGKVQKTKLREHALKDLGINT